MIKKFLLLFILLFLSRSISAQLAWETKTVLDRTYYRVVPCHDFYLTKLLYRENNQRKWRIRLPERMTNYIAETKPDVIDINTLEKPGFLNGPVIYLDKAIVVSDKSGLTVFNKNDGTFLYDKAYKREKDYFWFDHGYFVITISGEKWKGRTWSDAAFLTVCNDYIISFCGYNLIILDKSNFKELYNIPFDNQKYFNPDNKRLPNMDAEINIGKIKIWLTGRLYVDKYY